MTPINILRLVRSHWQWLVSIPLLTAILTYFILGTRDSVYESKFTVYTGFASGYSVTSGSDNQNYDYNAINNALDNLTSTIRSEDVMQKVGLTLFAQSLIYGAKSDWKYISKSSYDKLLKIVPDSVMSLINPFSVDSTVHALERRMVQDNDNFVYELIHLYHPNFSLWALQKIEIKRISNSDMLSVEYQSNDPALCQQTLIILGKEFTKHYLALREYQTHDVVRYFEEQLSASASRLGIAEDRFMQYSKDNRVINYYEQTKSVAGQLQAFELDYDKVLSMNAGAAKAIEQLEQKIGLHARLRLKSAEVLQERDRIAERTANLTAQSIFLDDSSYVRFDSRKIDDVVTRGKETLRQTLDTMDMYQNSPEGIEIDNILNQWLENVVRYDATNAALKVLDKRREEINRKFDFFAPVGATVKRQEREININESEYLSLLHSLALAKLQQQKIAMSSSALHIVDSPLYPIQAQPGKRKILTLASLFISFVLVLTILILLDLADKTLRNALRAKHICGLDVVSQLPINHQTDNVVENLVHNRAVSQFMAQIIRLGGSTTPLIINILSTQSGEGKSYVSSTIQKLFTAMGYRVNYQRYGVDFDINYRTYIEAQSPKSLAGTTINNSYDVLITELPPLTTSIIPLNLLVNANLNLLVVRANRIWQQSDIFAVDYLKQGSGSAALALYMVLNGVSDSETEVITGELPRKRSCLRCWLKKMITREFRIKH